LTFGWPVARLLHHATGGLHRDLDAAATELVLDLAGPQAGVAVPFTEYLLVALRHDVAWVWSGSGRVALALGGEADLALPVVDGEAADIELLVSRGHAMGRGVLEDLGLLRRGVALGHPCAAGLGRCTGARLDGAGLVGDS
jgi:hypothetical protein